MTAAAAGVNPLLHPIMLHRPRRLTDVSSWHEHIPFAMYLVDLLRPRMLVELGTHRGDSYCAFCQAVDELELPTQSYAVDTWTGDAQSGLYGPEVLEDLRMYHDPLYGSFSRLLQTTFDDAVSHFEDGTIDLLHIDGCHTYEAVKHDVETWSGKVSSRGVVRMHDSNYRAGDFEVWRLWDELSAQYPSFQFLHGLGLGVLLVGDDVPPEVAALAELDAENTARVRELFAGLGLAVRVVGEHSRLTALVAEQHRVLDDRGRALEEQRTAIEDLRGHLDRTAAHAERVTAEQTRHLERIAELEHELEALRATKLFRYSAPARKVYGTLRGRRRT
jgi:hypothetical protein